MHGIFFMKDQDPLRRGRENLSPNKMNICRKDQWFVKFKEESCSSKSRAAFLKAKQKLQ